MVDEATPALVVVVEDDEPSRAAIARLLRASGFKTALFDCAEAYMAAPPASPLCLILDVGLGGMSGIDLQQRLRRAGGAPPIIMTTGRRDELVRERAQRNGCVAFLWKPFDAEALLTAIGSIARESHA
ncbi:MAG TPA: response regulator [Vicinamibacterales bacterium]|nr:response regulator [Vicinamibacterales bacterium]